MTQLTAKSHENDNKTLQEGRYPGTGLSNSALRALCSRDGELRF